MGYSCAGKSGDIEIKGDLKTNRQGTAIHIENSGFVSGTITIASGASVTGLIDNYGSIGAIDIKGKVNAGGFNLLFKMMAQSKRLILLQVLL